MKLNCELHDLAALTQMKDPPVPFAKELRRPSAELYRILILETESKATNYAAEFF